MAPPIAPAPRLMLITPPIGDGEAALGPLAAALAAADVAAVIVRLAAADERAALARAKPVVRAIQDAGAAALLDGFSDLVGRSGADGLHLSGVGEPLRDAVERFRPEKIVGVAGLRSRHDAMTAGELDVDYLMFGEPDEAGLLPPLETAVDRVGWWAELFQSPCVAYARRLEDVAVFARLGADFVALGDAVWAAPDGPAAALRRAASGLVVPEGAA